MMSSVVDEWKEHRIILFADRLVCSEVAVIASEQQCITETVELSLGCVAFETNIRTGAFELVTPSMALHMAALSDSMSMTAAEWVQTLQQCIQRLPADPGESVSHCHHRL